MRVISGTAKGSKLQTLEGNETRPTLDRVKEALFNILQNDIQGAYVLDMFAGSGALGIEALSRGAKFCAFCDKSNKAVKIINDNIEKTKLEEKALVIKNDYIKAINVLKKDYKFDLIFIDPPYKLNIATNAVETILELDILSDDGIIVIETDEVEREIKSLDKININVQDLRKYGRVNLIFLNRKG